MARRLIVIAAVVTLFLAGPVFWQAAYSAGKEVLPNLIGVYKGEGVEIILAGHPLWRSEYIGQIVYSKDQRIQPMKINCDAVKGCHSVIYDGSTANQSAAELKIEGDRLILRHYNGPELVLVREKER